MGGALRSIGGADEQRAMTRQQVLWGSGVYSAGYRMCKVVGPCRAAATCRDGMDARLAPSHVHLSGARDGLQYPHGVILSTAFFSALALRIW